MATVTDTDLQQLKDLITTGNAAIQKQIADGDAAAQKQIAGVEVGLAEVKAEIKGIQTQLADIKADQRQQDNRFFGLSIFIITSAVGIAAKLAKLY
jgi:hypothetical protein